MKIVKRAALAALLGLSLIPLRLATAQEGTVRATLTILAPTSDGAQVKVTTCTATTCTTVIVVN
jgi:hypothetical protein